MLLVKSSVAVAEEEESLLYIRFDSINVFINDLNYIDEFFELVSMCQVKSAVFDVYYANICCCYDSRLSLYVNLCCRQMVFVCKQAKAAIDESSRMLHVNENDGFQLECRRFQIFDVNVYLSEWNQVAASSSSYLLASIGDIDGHFYCNFQNLVTYKSKLMKISNVVDERTLHWFTQISSNSDFQVNIDLWNKLCLTLPLFISFITRIISKDETPSYLASSVMHLNLGSFHVNLVSSNTTLFKFHQQNAKFEVINTYSEHVSTQINSKISLLDVYSFINKHPILSTNKELSFYFKYKQKEIEFECRLQDGETTTPSKTIVTLYNLLQNINMVELCFRQLRSLKQFTPLERIKSNISTDTLLIKFLPKHNDTIFLNVSQSSFRFSYPHQEATTAILAILGNLSLTTEAKQFEIACERLVVETLIELLDAKLQLLSSPVVFTSTKQQKRSRNATMTSLSHTSMPLTYLHSTQLPQLNENQEAVYVSVVQIRVQLFYNEDICYSNQTEFIIGDVFGTMKFEDLLSAVDLVNSITEFVINESNDESSLIYRVDDGDLVEAYTSLRLHSSLVHVNIIHKPLKAIPEMKHVALNLVISPLRFGYCDFHCQNGLAGYLGHVTGVYLRLMCSNTNEYNWIECGLATYQHLSVYKCLENSERRTTQISLLLNKDQITKRLRFLWNDESSASSLSNITRCACTGNAKFFSSSFDKSKFYTVEDNVLLKPCIYVKNLDSLSDRLSFGQSILQNSVHTFYSYQIFDNWIPEKCDSVVKISFDEGNNFKAEKTKKTDNPLPYENVITTPPVVHKRYKDFSLHVEYLPFVKNISNVRYDPQKENYLVKIEHTAQHIPMSTSFTDVTEFMNRRNDNDENLSRKKNHSVKFEHISQTITMSTSLKQVPEFVNWIKSGESDQDTSNASQVNSVSSAVSSETTISSSSAPVSLSILSAASLYTTIEEGSVSDLSSLHSYITPVFSNSFDTFQRSREVSMVRIVPQSELVLKLANYSKISVKLKRKKNAATKQRKLKKSSIHIVDTLEYSVPKIKINRNINNSNNDSSPREGNYRNLLSTLRFTINQQYPTLKFNINQIRRTKKSSKIVEITLTSFEYIKLGNKNAYKSASKTHASHPTGFYISNSNHLVTPLAIDALNALIEDYTKPRRHNTNRVLSKTEDKMSVLFEHVCFNIIWSCGDTDNENHTFKILLNSTHISHQQTINIQETIIDLSKPSSGVEHEINIKQTVKQFSNLLKIFVINHLAALKLFMNRIMIIDTTIDSKINLPGLSIITEMEEESRVMNMSINLNDWSIKQSMPSYYMLNTVSLIYNISRYMALEKRSIPFKLTLIVTNLDLRLTKIVSKKEHYVLTFTTKSIKLRLSNTFELKNLFMRLLTTIRLTVELYTDVVPAIRIITTGSEVNSNESTSDVISVATASSTQRLVNELEILVTFDKRVLDASIEILVKQSSDEQQQIRIKLIFPLIIESKFEFINENEFKLKLPGMLASVLSAVTNEIMHVVEFIETTIILNDLERKILLYTNKSRIINSKNVSLIDFFTSFYNHSLELYNYRIQFIYGELCYSYFFNRISDKEWLYVKLYEFEVEYEVKSSTEVNTRFSIEYCKNAYKQQMRDIELLLLLADGVRTSSLSNREFQLKNSIVLYVTSEYSVPEKFDYNNWLSYACIDTQRTYGYTIKVVALFPTMIVLYGLTSGDGNTMAWNIEANFQQDMFIDSQLIEKIWKKFKIQEAMTQSILLRYTNHGIKINNLNVADFHTRKKLSNKDIDEFLDNFFTNHAYIFHSCLIEPFNNVHKFINLFK